MPSGRFSSPLSWTLIAFFSLAFSPEGGTSSNANNYFCKGCAAVVEASWERSQQVVSDLSQSMTAGVSGNRTVNFEKLFDDLCDDDVFRIHSAETVKDSCNQIISKNAFVVAAAFGGTFPDEPIKLYPRMTQVCMEKMDLCDPEDSPRYAQLSRCDLCLTVIDDIISVLTRAKGTAQYLSRKHVWRVLESECTLIGARFPPTASRKLRDTCEDLLADFDEDMADLLVSASEGVAKAVCGKSMSGMCRKRKGQWRGVPSPFANEPGTDVSVSAEL